MNKEALKERLLKVEKKLIKEDELNHQEFLTNNKFDWSGVETIDDYSHQVETEELNELLDQQIEEQKIRLNQIKLISFSPKETIEVGAVTKVNGKYFIIAVAEPRFEFEGKEFMGISTSAPIYNQLRGKKAGDEFVFNNLNFKIEAVY